MALRRYPVAFCLLDGVELRYLFAILGSKAEVVPRGDPLDIAAHYTGGI